MSARINKKHIINRLHIIIAELLEKPASEINEQISGDHFDIYFKHFENGTKIMTNINITLEPI